MNQVTPRLLRGDAEKYQSDGETSNARCPQENAEFATCSWQIFTHVIGQGHRVAGVEHAPRLIVCSGAAMGWPSFSGLQSARQNTIGRRGLMISRSIPLRTHCFRKTKP